MSSWSVYNLTYLRDIHGENVAHIPVLHFMPRWVAISKDDPLTDYRFTFTHAEAIEYAHEQATRQALAKHFTLPPESEPTC